MFYSTVYSALKAILFDKMKINNNLEKEEKKSLGEAFEVDGIRQEEPRVIYETFQQGHKLPKCAQEP